MYAPEPKSKGYMSSIPFGNPLPRTVRVIHPRWRWVPRWLYRRVKWLQRIQVHAFSEQFRYAAQDVLRNRP